MDPLLMFTHVAKKYTLRPGRPRSFQEVAVGWLWRRRRSETRELWALRDISLDVGQGEVVGIVGDNGAGKSTLLKLAARIIDPTHGRVVVNGRVGALLEVGVGFHPDLTGRENIYLNGAIIGLSRQEMDTHVDEIVAFSGIGDYIGMPVRHYSSGMLVRLGFSVATCISPDILLVDETLSVGDQTFRLKCLERISTMRSQGMAILLVSHNLDEIRSICDRAVWIEDGRIREQGSPEQVVRAYGRRAHCADRDPTIMPPAGHSLPSSTPEPPAETRLGVHSVAAQPIPRRRPLLPWHRRHSDLPWQLEVLDDRLVALDRDQTTLTRTVAELSAQITHLRQQIAEIEALLQREDTNEE